MRNFWSGVSVTRSRFPFRSRIHCENEIPSRSGGFGRASQSRPQDAMQSMTGANTFLALLDAMVLLIVILIPPLREKDLTHGARITLGTRRDPSPCGRSLSSFGMTSIVWRASFYCVTVIRPPTPRPLTFRSYIDWAKTGGTTNSPRLHDLIL